MDKFLFILWACIMINIINPQIAFAYLDPNTGSMILQTIIAAAVGVGCTFKIWGAKFRAWFNKK